MASRSGSAATAVLPSYVTRSVPPEIGGGGTLAVTVDWKVGLGPLAGPAPGRDTVAAWPHGPPPEHPAVGDVTIWSAQPPAIAGPAHANEREIPKVDFFMVAQMAGRTAIRVESVIGARC